MIDNESHLSILVAGTWRSMAINLLIAVAEGVTVIVHQRRRHRRIAEPRMTIRIGRRSLCDIATSRLNTIMVALVRGLRIGGRRVIGRWLRMGTTRESKWK
jgi:hypothetical protein